MTVEATEQSAPYKHATRTITRISYLAIMSTVSRGLTHLREPQEAIELANQVLVLASEIIKANRNYLRNEQGKVNAS